MGPPPFSDGNDLRCRGAVGGVEDLQWGHRLSAMETTSAAAVPSAESKTFNGATAFQRWKLGNGLPAAMAFSALQWGHRLSAMETSPPQAGGGR